MSGNHQRSAEYKAFANKIAAKRADVKARNLNPKKKKTEGLEWTQHILRQKEITVQLLSSEPSSASKKYQRLGAQVFVDFPYEEVTIENLIAACTKKFQGQMEPGQTVDILASERGPSCTRIGQLGRQALKVVCIRIVMKKYDVSSSSLKQYIRPRSQSVSIRSSKDESSHVSSVTCPPASVPISQMLKMGKVVEKTIAPPTPIEVHEFSMGDQAWKPATSEKFRIESEELARGGFRSVFKATPVGGFGSKHMVLKKFLPSTLTEIELVGETPEQHARKSVQMHMLAKHFAEKSANMLRENDFNGTWFKYSNSYFGRMIETGEPITLEAFVPGTFVKYVNNTGVSCAGANSDTLQKAESLCHFSYQKSDQNLMLLDVQGCGMNLFDPEICTVTSPFTAKSQKLLFCVGNLSTKAFKTFFAHHQCNEYCHLLGLDEVISSES